MSGIKEVWPNASDNKNATWYESTATNDVIKPEPGPRMKEIDKLRDIDEWPTAADNFSNKK